ncbi:MAG TPA: alpha/beta fold hydrolase [Jiangellaceae bacterium]
MVTFVLIPGAGGEAWYWHRVVAELDRRGRVGVAVDLPAADETAGLSEYVEAVVQAIGDRRQLVLVAQSLGGFTAPMVCERVPVDLLVLLNAMIPSPGESGEEWWTNTRHDQARAQHAELTGRTLSDEFDPFEEFFHDVPQDVIDEAMRRGEPAQSSSPMAQPWPLAAWPDVPTRVLTARDDRFFPAEFQRRVALERLGIEPDEMPGGHLVALSRPAELTDRLEAYVAELAPTDRSSRPSGRRRAGAQT